jgi:hypothetical protein
MQPTYLTSSPVGCCVLLWRLISNGRDSVCPQSGQYEEEDALVVALSAIARIRSDSWIVEKERGDIDERELLVGGEEVLVAGSEGGGRRSYLSTSGGQCRESAGVAEASHRVRLQTHLVQTPRKGKFGEGPQHAITQSYRMCQGNSDAFRRLQTIG